MKNIILAISLVFLVACSAENKKNKFSLEGTVVNVTSGKVYLQKFDEKIFVNIDSADVVDGKFSFTKEIELPEIYGLSLEPSKGSYLIFLENKPITVTLDSASRYSSTIVEGSDLQAIFLAYKQDSAVNIQEFIKQHPASLVSAYALYRDYAYKLTPEEISENIALLSPELKETPYIKTLEKLVGVYETVSIGKKAPDFEAYTPAGDTVRLSDKLGKGYLLIDFWASWCPPCRKENPNLVKAYAKYNAKGFDILAISLDQSKESWIKAIEKDGLTWTQVSDLKYWHSEPAQLYGVRVIPSNFLVNAEGEIVGKNLKGEELDKVLSELLK